MELELKKPIGLHFAVVEIEDEHLPSFKVEANIQINHPTGKVIYLANDIWYDCTDWDSFVNNLKQLVQSDRVCSAKLSDMGNGVVISFDMSNDRRKCMFQIAAKEPETGMGTLSIDHKAEITLDELGEIKSCFDEFPSWW